jgi:hypothetical protein
MKKKNKFVKSIGYTQHGYKLNVEEGGQEKDFAHPTFNL